jgi:hypothetical protein
MMDWKDLEGSGCGLVEVLTRQFPEAKDEKSEGSRCDWISDLEPPEYKSGVPEDSLNKCISYMC